jgi:pimeloyl-ACP methyl ester carboxylesterase
MRERTTFEHTPGRGHRQRRLRPLRLLVIALLVIGATTGGSAAADSPPTLTEACGTTSGLDAHSSWLMTSDGVRLYTIEAGRGSTAIVLAHQGRSDLCDTLPYAATLVPAGFRVLAFDFRGWGRSQSPSRNRLSLGRDLAAVVARAREEGVEHVFLIGASMGGAAVVQNTSALRVDGRISLSGTRLWTGFGINNPKGLKRIRAPFLYIGTLHDWRAPMKEALGIFRKVGARDKHAVFYSGSLHGWDLVDTARFAPNARARILKSIRSRS